MKFKTIREKLGITQQEAARMLGLTPASIAFTELGGSYKAISPANQVKLTKLYKRLAKQRINELAHLI